MEVIMKNLRLRSRRLDLPVEFPLMDCQGKFVKRDRRRLSDRRMGNYDHDALKIIPTLYNLAFDLVAGARVQSRNRHQSKQKLQQGQHYLGHNHQGHGSHKYL